MMLTFWKQHRAAVVKSNSNELYNLTHLNVWFAYSFPVFSAEAEHL